jgi:methylated-DNA-protein-cysteine methyltransferase-like protein
MTTITTQANQNRERIWQIVSQIPPGKVASYGQIATLAGLPRGARLVGHVMNKLPQETRLPWHRVINSQGKISLPVGSAAHTEQKARLIDEGIIFNHERISLVHYGWQP